MSSLELLLPLELLLSESRALDLLLLLLLLLPLEALELVLWSLLSWL
jgi:hypothetical protein